MEVHLFIIILMLLLLMIEKLVVITITLEECCCWIAVLISLLCWVCERGGVFPCPECHALQTEEISGVCDLSYSVSSLPVSEFAQDVCPSSSPFVQDVDLEIQETSDFKDDVARKIQKQELAAEIGKEMDSFVVEVLKIVLEEIEKGALDLCSVSKEQLTSVIIPQLIENLNYSDEV